MIITILNKGHKMNKKLLILSCVLFLGSFLYGEILTKAAVIDLDRIIMVFYQESEPVRELESFRDNLQIEINAMSNEINNLKDDKVKAFSDKKNSEVERLSDVIIAKETFFRAFYESKQRQLKEMKDKLSLDSEFYKKLVNHVEFVAQSNGYTYVMKNSDPELFWFSPEIDITDLVIESIRSRN